MSNWVLDWCDSNDSLRSAQEQFSSKEAVLERLEELEYEISNDELEYSYYKVFKCPCCGSFVTKDELKEKAKK